MTLLRSIDTVNLSRQLQRPSVTRIATILLPIRYRPYVMGGVHTIGDEAPPFSLPGIDGSTIQQYQELASPTAHAFLIREYDLSGLTLRQCKPPMCRWLKRGR